MEEELKRYTAIWSAQIALLESEQRWSTTLAASATQSLQLICLAKLLS